MTNETCIWKQKRVMFQCNVYISLHYLYWRSTKMACLSGGASIRILCSVFFCAIIGHHSLSVRENSACSSNFPLAHRPLSAGAPATFRWRTGFFADVVWIAGTCYINSLIYLAGESSKFSWVGIYYMFVEIKILHVMKMYSVHFCMR